MFIKIHFVRELKYYVRYVLDFGVEFVPHWVLDLKINTTRHIFSERRLYIIGMDIKI